MLADDTNGKPGDLNTNVCVLLATFVRSAVYQLFLPLPPTF